jgi:hypothetical protein
MLRKLQDTLSAQKKLLLVIFAAGKASFYPEYIPNHLKGDSGISNYICFRDLAIKHHINHIDFNRWFVSQKHKSRFSLYPQFGIHWSTYGSWRAFDSIVNYIKQKKDCCLPELALTSVSVTDSMTETDQDVALALNIYKLPKTFRMAIPNYEIVNEPGDHKKLDLLTIGDSFWWQIFGDPLSNSVFSKNSFWYYNRQMYPESYTQNTEVYKSDYMSRVNEADVILIIYSEATLKHFGDGFIEMVYEGFYDPGARVKQINRVKEQIRTSPDWFNFVREDAVEKNISVDSALTLHTLYHIELQRARGN